MPSKNVIIAVTLSILMVMSAGCAGWGTDGPANPDEETDGNGDVQTNESPGDSQETESDDSGTEEEQQGGEENSDTSTSTDSPEESSTGEDTDKTDANGPSEADDGETVDSTEKTDTTDETETDSSQRDSDQGDTSPSSNGGDDNGDGSPASGGNNENGGEEPSENGENGDSESSDENGDETPTNSGDGEKTDNGDNGNNDGDGENGEQVTCDAFDTQEEAQEYFDENPEERSHLDENDDGIPCEHLPSEGNGDEEVYTLTVEADSPVTLERNWEDASTTREPTDGIVEFSVIAGEYTLLAEGYEDEVVTVKDDKMVTMAPVEPESHTLIVTFERIDNGDAVTGGVVIQDENGNQVVETHMDSPGENYNADENQYEFELPAGEYQVSGHMMGSITMNVAPDESTRTITLDQDQAITFPVEYRPPEQEVTITVTDEENTPIEGASVKVNDETKETSEDGTVAFSLRDGEYGVSVSAAGYQDGSTTIEVDYEDNKFTVILEKANGNGGDSNLVVSTIHANAAGNDHNNLNDEYIELTNGGGSAIEMTGWTLSDEDNHTYTFSEFTLEPGDSVTIYTGSGSDSNSELYWRSEAAIWNNDGDTIIVINDDGESVIQREYPG